MLTEQELEFLKRTAELWGLFLDLPNRHPSDADEMARDIHSIQNRVMARVAVRVHPEFFK